MYEQQRHDWTAICDWDYLFTIGAIGDKSMTEPTPPQPLREAIEEILKDFEVWAHDYSDEEGQTHTQVQPQKATQSILALLQAHQQELLSELLGGLPEKKDFQMAVRTGSAIWGAQIDAHNDCLKQVVSVIKSKIGELNG